jgi:hypothetical protein
MSISLIHVLFSLSSSSLISHLSSLFAFTSCKLPNSLSPLGLREELLYSPLASFTHLFHEQDVGELSVTCPPRAWKAAKTCSQHHHLHFHSRGQVKHSHHLKSPLVPE